MNRQVVMNSTKTLKTIRACLPEDGIAILKWHEKTQLVTPGQLASELLFPNDEGGFRSTTCLWKPFEQVADALGLKKRITPKAMRRTFNDLSRMAGTAGLITRSITGHETEEMQDLYSTVSPAEKRAAISKVISLMGYLPPRPLVLLPPCSIARRFLRSGHVDDDRDAVLLADRSASGRQASSTSQVKPWYR